MCWWEGRGLVCWWEGSDVLVGVAWSDVQVGGIEFGFVMCSEL